MKIKGLFIKLYGLILVPTIAFVILAGIGVFNSYDSYSSNKFVAGNIPVVRASINLFTKLQIERGMSIAYVNGANNFSKIEAHRKKVDSDFDALLSEVKSDSIDISSSLSLVREALALREKIKNKEVVKKDIAKPYTKAILELMGNVTKTVQFSTDPQVIETLINVSLLAEAQENGGLLRANLSAILARKKGMSIKELAAITKFKGSFNSLSKTSSLAIKNEKSIDSYQNFLNMKEHEVIDKTYFEVIKNLDATEYGINSTEFFGTITKVLNQLNATILKEIDHVDYLAQSNSKSAFMSLILLSASLGGYFILASIFTIVIIGRIVKRFRQNLHALNNKALSISLITDRLTKNSTIVNQASNSQADDIEETSSAVYEVNQIIKMSNDLVTDVQNQTQESSRTVEQGKSQVNNMINSINEISKSNEALVNQVQENNKNFEKITEVINEINQKTSIINDIVFQTKLLSFNASVEAARAGEHGKGFAVVAEEIGALANLSGNAANEIAELVTSSSTLVNDISKEMVEKVDYFVDENKSKIAEGNKEAENCLEIFQSVYDKIASVTNSMNQLKSSASEQNNAMSDISNSVSTLDSATKSNLKTIQDNNKLTTTISVDTDELKSIVDDMCIIIRGEVISEEDRKNYLLRTNGEKSNIIEIGNSDKKAA